MKHTAYFIRCSIVTVCFSLSCMVPAWLQSLKSGRQESAAAPDTTAAADTARAAAEVTESVGKTTAAQIVKPEPAGRETRTRGPHPMENLFQPVEQWPGKRFIILEKVEMFREYGHYLYTTPLFSDDPRPADPAVELPNHRLKYLPFAGRKVTIRKTARRPGGEYLVEGVVDTLGLTVYGLTSAGVIEGLLLEDDLVGAKWRWSGATLYSRRRLIDVYDSAQSKFTNVKVSILEPLKVITVRTGIIPLPPKPVWLEVERSDSSRGIIPLNYSWTNVVEAKRTDGFPWQYDIIEDDPLSLYPSWEQYTWETIDHHHVHIGMSREQVKMSWGMPLEVIMSDASSAVWRYGNSRLVFHGDSLAQKSDR